GHLAGTIDAGDEHSRAVGTEPGGHQALALEGATGAVRGEGHAAEDLAVDGRDQDELVEPGGRALPGCRAHVGRERAVGAEREPVLEVGHRYQEVLLGRYPARRPGEPDRRQG